MAKKTRTRTNQGEGRSATVGDTTDTAALSQMRDDTNEDDHTRDREARGDATHHEIEKKTTTGDETNRLTAGHDDMAMTQSPEGSIGTDADTTMMETMTAETDAEMKTDHETMNEDTTQSPEMSTLAEGAQSPTIVQTTHEMVTAEILSEIHEKAMAATLVIEVSLPTEDAIAVGKTKRQRRKSDSESWQPCSRQQPNWMTTERSDWRPWKNANGRYEKPMTGRENAGAIEGL